jgi:2-iminobutanoate/2-iminopropanoate deaminase
MSKKEIIRSDKAPKAIGPYNVATRFGNLVFAAGQAGLVPETMELAPGGIAAETRQTLINLKYVLEAAGTSMENALKTTVYLRDMADFAAMNAVYAEFFGENPPARTTIQAAGLPKGAAVEIDIVACLES